MNKQVTSIKRNAILNSIRTVLSIIFPLITFPYVSRLLQADNLGKVNFASSTMGYFSLLAVLGLTGYAGREGIKYRDNTKKLNEFCAELLTVNICTTMFAYVVLVCVVWIFPIFHEYVGLLIIYSTTILFSTLGMDWLYTIHEDYVYITIRSIIFQVISLVLMFLFVKKEGDYYIYAAINVLASVGGNIFDFIHARKYIKPRLCFNTRIFCHLKTSCIFFASSIASSIYSNIDITMLGILCSDYCVGIYSVSVKIFSVIRSVLSAIMTVTNPRLTYYRMNNMENDFNHLVSRLIKTMFILVLPMIFGINLTAKEIIVVISGERYLDAVPSLRILSFALLASVLACITSSILLASKKEKLVLRGTVSAAIVNLALNTFFIPKWAQNGAALTTVLAEIVVFAVGYFYARKNVKIIGIMQTVVDSVIGCCAMCAVSFIINELLSNYFLLLFVKVIVCMTLYFIILVLLKNDIVCDFLFSSMDRARRICGIKKK